MKQLFTIGLTVLLSIPAFARVYTVNNQIAANDAGKYLYKSITDAHNAAVAGDTLYVLGSSIDYNTSTNITKKLVIIGPGYFLDDNTGTQFNKQMASVKELVFKAGSEGSKVIGVNFYNSSGGVTINANQINVQRCLFAEYVYVYISSGSSSISIQSPVVMHCFFLGDQNTTSFPVVQSSSYAAVSNLIFANNVCLRPFALMIGSTANIVNNTFVRNSFNVTGSTITMTNNILMGTDKTKILLPANTAQITYNIAETDVFGTSNGNKAFATSANLFAATGTSDGMYQIKSTGPAYNAGLNGQSMGAFGGTDPYRLSGLPSIPAIYQLTTTGMGSQSGSLDITIKAKTN